MRIAQRAVVPGLTLALLGFGAAPARAQQIELGAPLFNATIGLTDESVSAVGAPAGGLFGVSTPGVYVSFFASPRVAIEPQIAFVTVWADGESAHFLTTGVQLNYLFGDPTRKVPYVFGGVGLVTFSDADTTPAFFTTGAGYRMPLGGRLVFRLDGRYTHYTGDDDLDTLSFTFSIGGLFR